MAEDAAFFHEVEGVAVVGRQAQIVNHDEDGLAALLQIIEKEELMADVQVVRGLVKNDRVHTLGYRPGKEDHFPLAAGECLNVSPGKIGDFQLLHSMADDLFGGSFLFFRL